jgi:hypothetical protein
VEEEGDVQIEKAPLDYDMRADQSGQQTEANAE